MIYVLKTDAPGETFYKVGYTRKEIKRRMAGLQTGCPYRLELVKTMQGSPAKEKELHQLLHPSRVHGEWFKDDFFVRETLGIYDWKGFPHAEFSPTSAQQKVIEFFEGLDGVHSWTFGSFLKMLAVSEDEIRRIPFGKRRFDIGLYEHEMLSSMGQFHCDPFRGKILCIVNR